MTGQQSQGRSGWSWGGWLILGGLSLLSAGCSPGLWAARAVNPADLPPCVDDDCNCGDFLSQPQAQRVLDSFRGDPYGLDGDGNGLACEGLPPSSPQMDPPGPVSDNPHLGLGNPSHAGRSNPNNYLIERSQYALAYSRDRKVLHWASWQLHAGWLGGVDRQDNFRPDGALPQGFYQVTPNDYRGGGYDRGHVVASGDRSRTVRDNSATFLMTNIWPQAPQNNRGPWRELEEYARSLVYQYDRSLHIFAGAYGQQGSLGDRAITIPARLWKIILVYDRSAQGGLGLTGQSQVIAVDMPNSNQVSEDWRRYQTTIHRIEVATGYQFLSHLPEPLQAQLKQRPLP
ncbi:MAG TPA: DNA/RNA non-specific endonuclease [Leptolyngbyaceae cyanobacterium M65_K2018_010]|nr:DNA/RNA non-specific endonuclease [Leptolyngbyaceae cyanobacterium M65_K2018_010]